MNIRQILVGVIFFGVLFLHASTQSASWRAHRGQAVPATAFAVGAGAWDTLSFPVFFIVPRRLHHTYFWELMLLNSATWAASAAILGALLLRFGRR